ncbi:MAG: sigma-54 dependent transcriptional regulator [Pirellulaceae bacterium]|nr:sigma-54 dependent transcriptional regulator [Pirellulaceae bacterium]
MKHATILVVDDEQVVCQGCTLLLAERGHDVSTSQDSRQALALAQDQQFDVILVDLRMPGLDGMSFLRTIKDVRPDTEVIVMTGYAEIASAVAAIKLGAFDYIPKPFRPEQLVLAVDKALQTRDIRAENRYLRRELQSRYTIDTIVGNSPCMRSVYELIQQVSATNVTVLIRGESGTGKELVARAIHFSSPRKSNRFVAVDCGALHESLLESELFGHAKGAFTGATSTKKGLFEVADGGTLFLDEIAHTSLLLQAKLLRVLQERVFTPVGDTRERKTDMRLVAATNKDLEAMVAEGSFRQELFYRLNIVPITLPPLRARTDDIPALAMHFLRKFRQEAQRDVPDISPEAMQLLMDYPWPGNVRELENAMHRISVLCSAALVTPAQLPVEIGRRPSLSRSAVPTTLQELKHQRQQLRRKAVETLEREFLVEALERHQGNVSRAASEVGMHRSNFQALMRRYGIERPPREDTRAT